ncbi:phytanoyl-CoA dioxygenase family protein [Micromonospora sp. NBC_00421]|uniref:phytanoyl-CoA dioxygenase family protein n=1 Tax=Micromonospora sp. NBC_00421 TaxID=2975976 RepID=UPI002E1FF9E2
MPLSDAQVRIFHKEGVLVAESIFDDADLAPIIDEYAAWLTERANTLRAEGRLADLYPDMPFARRTALLHAQAPEITEHMDIATVLGPATFAFLRHPRLLAALELLIGAEITCNPIQHVRAKPPADSTGARDGFHDVPWHQDAATMSNEADNSDIVTCWIPLVDTTRHNGCLEVIPHAWRGGYIAHGPGPRIASGHLPAEAPRPAPVRRGGVVFMHRYTPHRSTPNLSDHTRWSIDLRYQPTGTPTGRPFHPSFVVQSRQQPAEVFTDYAAWCQTWRDALAATPEMRSHRT